MAKASQKAGKPSNKKLKTQNKKEFKPKKPMSLKQKLHKESKIVKVDNLKWKEVEIPDNLDDYQGFFGLEEIEGVDIKYVDGKAEFVVKEDKNIIEQNEQNDEKDLDGEIEDLEDKIDEDDEDEEDQDEDEENQDEEFTGFSDDDETITESTKTKLLKGKKAAVEKKSSDPETLQGNVFDSEALLELPDDIDLPNWQNEESGLSLSPYILNGLSALNFKKPTPIQRETIPLAISGKDVIGKATTGSGKTLAYGIPILERYLNNLETIKLNRKNNIINPPTGIIFAPTRELAHQVVDHLNRIAKYSPLTSHGIVSITGGLSIQKQERLLLHGPGILVATPGRCLELLQKDIELVKRLASTDIVVLDEADRLLQDGHFEEFEKILDLFKKHRPKLPNKDWKWQTLVFSATFARDLFGKLDKFQKKSVSDTGKSLFDNDEILKILNDKLNFKDKKPVLIDANPKEIVSGQVTEALVECGPVERDLYLYYFLLLYPGSTLVFANSIDSVKRLVPFLNNLNVPAFAIHSSMMQKQRLRSLERFKEASEKNETAVLVASDVAARGLDIPNIDHVAHYHLPRSADVYIHRSGRTARAGKEGVSVMFCSPQEASGPLRKLRKIVANNSSKNSRLNMHTDVKLLPIEMDLITQIRQRVAVSAKLADSTISSTSTRKESSWVKQAAEELGVDHLSDVDDFEDDIIKKQRKRKEGKLLSKQEYNSLKFELKNLLLQQLRKNHRRSYLTSGLENLAHQMVTGDTHKEVLGHIKVNALNDISGSKAKSKMTKSKNKPNKVTKKGEKSNKDKSKSNKK